MSYTSIILSGLPASGKTTLAKKLSSHYHWRIHSLGQLWRNQWKEKYPQEEIPFEDYWRQTSLADNREINRKAKEIFKRGEVIGDSRYAIYCKDLPSLLIFVTAPLEIRASRSIEKYPGKSPFDREKILKERERDEVERGRQIFGEDYDYREHHHYHLTLNSGVLTVEQEFTLVRSLMETQ